MAPAWACQWTPAQGRSFLQQHRRSSGSLGLAQEFDEPVCTIIKHTNLAERRRARLSPGYKKALECDPVSPCGVIESPPIDAAAAEEMHKLFLK